MHFKPPAQSKWYGSAGLAQSSARRWNTEMRNEVKWVSRILEFMENDQKYEKTVPFK
jgi:hypothetical protein